MFTIYVLRYSIINKWKIFSFIRSFRCSIWIAIIIPCLFYANFFSIRQMEFKKLNSFNAIHYASCQKSVNISGVFGRLELIRNFVFQKQNLFKKGISKFSHSMIKFFEPVSAFAEDVGKNSSKQRSDRSGDKTCEDVDDAFFHFYYRRLFRIDSYSHWCHSLSKNAIKKPDLSRPSFVL